MSDVEDNATRAALKRLMVAVKAIQSEKLPEPTTLLEALRRLGAPPRDPPRPQQARLDEARKALIVAAQTGDVRAAGGGKIRDAAWLLWDPRDPLVRLPGLLEAVVDLCRRSSFATRRLVQAWMMHFSSAAPRIADGGHWIRACLAARLADSRLDVWRDADRRWSLFDARNGPTAVARAILAGDDEALRMFDMDAPGGALLGVGGYAGAIQKALADAFAPAARGAQAEQAVSLCKDFLAPRGGLRFDDAASCGEIARGLLAPWLDGGVPPAHATREATRVFLISALGDPRLAESRWSQAGERATALVVGWLTEATIGLFFELIKGHADEVQFPYRKAFWAACIEKRVIDEAWLALGGNIYADARAHKTLKGGYGRLRAAGADQAVLMMRIGRYVFCDWSHNGKLRAWDAEDRVAPRLRRMEYHREDFMAYGLPFPPGRFGGKGAPDGAGLVHGGSDTHRWQGSAAVFLAQRCNIHLSPSDWSVRP